MDTKVNVSAEGLVSIKRIEFLLEEIIFQQIMTRMPEAKIEQCNEKFSLALEKVESRLKSYVESVVKEEPNTPISVW